MKQNILFTCAGRRNYLINYFKEALNGNGNVLAVDQDLLAPALVDADISIQVPDIYDPSYISKILEISKANFVTAIISLNDLELPILSKNKFLFEQEGIQVIVSNENVIDIGFDKLKTFNFVKGLGLNTPKTYTTIDEAIQAINEGDLKFPLVLKPRWGSASIGIDFPETIEELKLSYKLQKIKIKKTILGLISENDIEHSILIQEKLDGKEFGLDIVNDFDGNYFASFAREKLSMRSGETDKALSVIDSRLEKLGEKLGSKLRHIGNMDCDAFLVGDDFYLLEMNPRFGGGYPFSHESGVNLAAIYLEWLKKGNKKNINKFNNYKSGIIFSKCDRLLKINKPITNLKNTIQVITEKNEWDATLKDIDTFDFYHTFDYHNLSKLKNETPLLLKYVNGNVIIALPLLSREIPGTNYKDATSVYGYAGPLCSGVNENFDNTEFQLMLKEYFIQNNYVSIFSRLNPFIPYQHNILMDLGKITNQGKVVNIDLTKDTAIQRQDFQSRLKTYINKTRKCCSVKEATSKEDIQEFIDIYYENMTRVKANKFYYFNNNYFEKIFNSNNFESLLLFAIDNETGEKVAASQFIITNNIVQYHLSGTKNGFLHLMPTKLLIDEMRLLASERGLTYFNLGGGLGGRDNDSLFDFKSSFSKDFKDFNLWKLIINQEIYDALVSKKKVNVSSDFFPQYRSLDDINVEL